MTRGEIEFMNFVCDRCGDKIPFEEEVKCEKCEFILCDACTDRCVECGEPICCNVGIFKSNMCIKCEKELYLELVEVRLNR